MESIPAIKSKLPKKASRILYRANNIQLNYNVFWRINTDGTYKKALKFALPCPFEIGYHQSGLLTDDGRQLVYVAELEYSDCYYIYTCRTSGTKMKRLTRVITDNIGLMAIVGNTTIYYWRCGHKESSSKELWKIDIDGSNHIKIDIQVPGIADFKIESIGLLTSDRKTNIFTTKNFSTKQQSIYKCGINGDRPELIMEFLPNEIISVEDITEENIILFRKIVSNPTPTKWAGNMADPAPKESLPELWAVTINGTRLRQINLQLPDHCMLNMYNVVKSKNGKLYIGTHQRSLLKNTIFSCNLDGSDLKPLLGSNHDIAVVQVY